jgi:hypothetical protein
MYKIKFLESLSSTSDGTEIRTTIENIYGEDRNLTNLAKGWKTILGFKRVESIEIMKGAKLKLPEVVEMFYPSKNITPEQQVIKDRLLSKDVQSKQVTQPKEATQPKGDDELKELLIKEAEALGIKVTRLMKLETIQRKIDEQKGEQVL